MADLRGCNWSVSGVSGWAWIKRFLAAAWPSIHHPDLCCAWTGPVTLRWPTDCSMGGWCGKHWDSHLFQFTLCLQASLMGNRFMLIRYSVHRKSHLMLHCKINLILARGGFIYKAFVSCVLPVWGGSMPYQCQHSLGLSGAVWSWPRSCYPRLTQAVLLHSRRRADVYVCSCVPVRVRKEKNRRVGCLLACFLPLSRFVWWHPPQDEMWQRWMI